MKILFMFDEKPHREQYKKTKNKKEKVKGERQEQKERLKDIEKEDRELSPEEKKKLGNMIPLTLRKGFRTVRKMTKSDKIDRLEQKLKKLKEEGREEAEELNNRYESLKETLKKAKKDVERLLQEGGEWDPDLEYDTYVINGREFKNPIRAYQEIAQEIVKLEVEELEMTSVER